MSLITSKKVLTLVLVKNEKEGKVLLGMKKRGFGAGKLNGFGGKVEKGETIDEGARRELLEESELEAIDLNRVGLLMFTFDDDPVGLETHVFTVTTYKGEPTETEEMRPEWYSYDQIPFDQMWADDRHWFPFLLKNRMFTGHFHFNKDEKTIVQQDLQTTESLIKEFDIEKIVM